MPQRHSLANFSRITNASTTGISRILKLQLQVLIEPNNLSVYFTYDFFVIFCSLKIGKLLNNNCLVKMIRNIYQKFRHDFKYVIIKINRMDILMEIPPITRAYVVACLGVNGAVQLGFLSPYHLYFNNKLIWEQKEVWRLATNFLYFGPMGLNFLFHFLFLYRYSRNLEEGSFRYGITRNSRIQ